MPSVISQFPVRFSNGFRWEDFDGQCLSCTDFIAREHVHGSLSRPIEKVTVVEAVGICTKCNFLSSYRYRLHDDGRITGQREDGLHTWMAKPSLKDTVLSKLRSLFR